MTMNSARNSYSEKNYEESLKYLNLIDKKNESYQTFILKGDNYYQLGNYEKALESYEIASHLNSQLVIENLIELYFLDGDMKSSLSIIEEMENNNLEISKSDRKIEYIALYRSNRKAEANAVLDKYLGDLDDYDIIKLRILSYDSTSNVVSTMLSQIYDEKKIDQLEELVDMCYSYSCLNSNYLSLLNKIYKDEELSDSFRIKCLYYISTIFKDINNDKQYLYYQNLYSLMKDKKNIQIPTKIWK